MRSSVNGNGRLAQLGEHLLDVQGVRGSSPLASTISVVATRAPVAQWIAFLIPIQKVAGSSPVGRAIYFFVRDVAQLGSALASGARGRVFKSRRPDH
jgi:hypothetical protein